MNVRQDVAPEFRLSTREEVVSFEQSLLVYQAQRCQAPLSHIDLPMAWDQLHARRDALKLFASLLDLWLTFVSMHLDMCAFGGTWNMSFSNGKLEGGSILDSQEKFTGKMDIHRHCTAYALRYRAFWDKWMGFMILLMMPAKYEEFCRAKSRKRAFGKLLESSGQLGSDLTRLIAERLTHFDDKFRTPEAHGPGVMRKWTLSMQSMTENPLMDLIGFWNLANIVMQQLGAHFRQGTIQSALAHHAAQQDHAAGGPQAARG